MPSVAKLCCEGLLNPLGIGTPTPRLSWELVDGKRGTQSVAWRIQLWDAADVLAWDSGITDSSAGHAIYSGAPLQPRGAYRWRVKAFLTDGAETAWSETADFECGFFTVADWPGHWLPYNSNLLRKDKLSVIHLRGEFSLRPGRTLRRARAFVAASGPHVSIGNDALRMNLYDFRLNGRKVGNDLLNPGQLALRRGRALFRAFDIAPLLAEHNAAGLVYAAGKVSVQIFLDYDDGVTERVGCGPDWRWNPGGGPFRQLWKHDIKEYGGRGEVYDARAELSGWDRPGFDDCSWGKAFPGSPPELLAPQVFGVQVDEVLAPKSVAKLPDGMSVIDFGRNFNGFASVKVRGETGSRIALRFAERLKPSGEVDCASTSCDPDFDQLDVYIKKSDAPEDYAPTFATHGFRYLAVEGQREAVAPSDFQGISITAMLPNRSSFHSSDPRLNRLHQLCVDTFKANMVSVPTDCPGRERNGWTADAYLVADAEFLNFDAIHLFRKWFDDVADMQEPDGDIPYVCPFPFPPYGKDIVWAACFTLAVWEAYRNTGDPTLLRKIYPSLVRLGDYLARYADAPERMADFIFFGGDHVAEERPTADFMGHVYCARNLELLARISRVLGETADARRFEGRAGEFKNLLNRRFVNASSGLYDNGSQSASAHALHFGLASGERRAVVLAELVAGIERKPAFTAGMLGYYSVMAALSENGRDDLVWRLVASDEPGAWGHWLKEFDATSASEVWLPEKNSNSWNHPMLVGGLSSWLYRGLGGVRTLTPGYGRIAVKPFFAPGIQDVAVTIDTPRGLVKSEWRREGQGVALSIAVPVNSRVEVCLPCPDPSGVFEGSARAADAEGVVLLRCEDGHSVFGTGSGLYNFNFTPPCTEG